MTWTGALIDRGRALRFDAALAPEGANINFISKDETGGGGGAGGGVWRMRTYERGIEARRWPAARAPWARAARFKGGAWARCRSTSRGRSGRMIGVRATKAQNGRYDDVWLIGEGRMVFRGVIT